MTDKLAKLREKYHDQEGRLLRRAFLTAGGSIRAAARWIGCPVSSLQRAVQRHPECKKS